MTLQHPARLSLAKDFNPVTPKNCQGHRPRIYRVIDPLWKAHRRPLPHFRLELTRPAEEIPTKATEYDDPDDFLHQ